jgi:hypothetical protein
MFKRASWPIALCLMVISGCGDSKDYELAPVSGVVTLDGQPVPQAEVVFQPIGTAEKSAPGPGSVARADESGRFELKTIRDEPGAVVGSHSVAIYSHREAPAGGSDVDVGPPRTEAIPARYNVDTKLTFDVPADGTTAADFKLTTQP